MEYLGTHSVKGWPAPIPVCGLITIRADQGLIELKVDLPCFNHSFLTLNIGLKNMVGD